MPTQNEFIQTIRSALGHDTASAARRRDALFSRSISREQEALLSTIAARTGTDREALFALLVEQAVPLNLAVTAVADEPAAAAAIADLVAATAPEWGDEKSVVRWAHPLLDRLDLETVLAARGVPVHTTRIDPDRDAGEQRRLIRRRIIDAYIGITSADFCLADTATLVMKTRPHQARAVSLVPSIHVAVIRRDQLLLNLKELYTLLRWDPDQWREGLTHHMTFISGPSKTADIELVMVHGAHGPRALHLFVIG